MLILVRRHPHRLASLLPVCRIPCDSHPFVTANHPPNQKQITVLQSESVCNLQVVKPGTNGGVSALGTAAGLAGGVLIGCCYCVFETWVAGVPHVTALGCRAVAVGAAAGMLGNLVDSVLGAMLQ